MQFAAHAPAKSLIDHLVALYAGLATSDRAPGFVRALARSQFLDGMYTRELLRVLEDAGPS